MAASLAASPLGALARRRVAAPRRRVAVARRGVASVRADATATKKVVVLGGSGFVGSRVVDRLASAGVAEVTSISKSGAAVPGASSSVAIDLAAAAASEALAAAFEGADAVVSCVGCIGGSDEDMRAGNGDANATAIDAAKAAGVKRFVYVSVASIVPDALGGAESAPVMKGYFAGKKMTEDAIANAFDDDNVCLVKPSFIFGGDTFGLNPPRVTQQYGDVLTKILGSGFVKGIAEKSPGPIALTLAEPVSVDDVAAAACAGALGRATTSECDGTDAIKACAGKLDVA